MSRYLTLGHNRTNYQIIKNHNNAGTSYLVRTRFTTSVQSSRNVWLIQPEGFRLYEVNETPSKGRLCLSISGRPENPAWGLE
ncbi:hypothetical protein DFP91_1697 [Pseudorhodoplanes sinuspersici]|nr:hypothetical protein DFP91_1697 [Pseudorhodoplanes sinuspersici]